MIRRSSLLPSALELVYKVTATTPSPKIGDKAHEDPQHKVITKTSPSSFQSHLSQAISDANNT